jgi:hypothetical protein
MVIWLNMVKDVYQRNAQLPHHGVLRKEDICLTTATFAFLRAGPACALEDA